MVVLRIEDVVNELKPYEVNHGTMSKRTIVTIDKRKTVVDLLVANDSKTILRGSDIGGELAHDEYEGEEWTKVVVGISLLIHKFAPLIYVRPNLVRVCWQPMTTTSRTKFEGTNVYWYKRKALVQSQDETMVAVVRK